MGIGNLLMGDEGIGIHVIRQLRKSKELADIEIILSASLVFFR